MNFADRLLAEIKRKNNPSVIGLDPNIDLIPRHLRESYLEGRQAEAVLEFNKCIIDSIHDIVPAVKPQLAYYEKLGHDGIRVLEETVRHARAKGLLVICDGKRNDIGSSAKAYSDAYLGGMINADAITVNPYLGYDGVEPFVVECKKSGKGIFVLVKTSNASSGQIQDIITRDGVHVYEKIAQLVESWGKDLIGNSGYSSVGAVVGATYPQQAKALRRIMKNAYFLVPGYGAQGGTADDTAVCFKSDGSGAVVNASRSVIYAYKTEKYCRKYTRENFGQAAREEAERMRDGIIKALRGASYAQED